MIHNLKKYKLAKVLKKDLTEIYKIMIGYEKQLQQFKKYSPIQKLLANLKINKEVIHFHLVKQSDILKTRGEDKDLEQEIKND